MLKPPKDALFYLKYVGMGLMVVTAFNLKDQRARVIFGIGLLLLAISFMRKKEEKKSPPKSPKQ